MSPLLPRKSNSPPALWKVAAAYFVAITAITVVVTALRWPPLIGLVGLPVGAFIVWRWWP